LPTSSPRKQRDSSLQPAKSVSVVLRNTTATTWETPQSFKESGVGAAVFYELAVRFVLGRFTPDNRYYLTLFLPASFLLPHYSTIAG